VQGGGIHLGSHPERKGLCLVGCRIACLNLILAMSKSAWFELSICSWFDIYCQLATYWRSDSVAVMVSSPRIHHSNSLLLDSADKNLY